MKRLRLTLIALLLPVLGASLALAQDSGWPRTVALGEGTVTIYPPQVDAMDGGVIYYRAALAYRPDAGAEPIFGAGWLKAPVEIDEGQRIVHPTRLELTQTRFPDGTNDVEAELATALARQSPDWNLDFSLDQLEAALETAEAESLAAQKLRTAPPKIIYRDRPALLVTIDGDPVLREIENSPYQAVINTPYPLITDGDAFYLNAAKGAWYRADAATGPYRFDANPPRDIAQMVEAAEAKAAAEAAGEADAAEVPPAEPVTAANAPEIVVSTEPAELIVTEGPADFVPLVDDLLVLQNSDDDVFMHVGTQQYYIVLAGRWYKAPSLNGPWEYEAADQLPTAFADIPRDSAQADSRVYVAGTDEAEQAVLDAEVPQTAAVKRGEVDIDVEYDGEPDFEPVDGTEDLRYAKNTGASVLQSDRVYYLLEDGVWYVSSSPHGPWVVSDHRPGELDAVQPSSPVYHTKYVYVYDATPEVVYVGYTPGYYGSYVYYNTIVYGTGWYYPPWVTPRFYYPRPFTWGFHAVYDYWGGWNFGLSWYSWPYSLAFYPGGYWHHDHYWHHRYYRRWWGPYGYRHHPAHYYHRHWHKSYAHSRYGHDGYRDRDRWDGRRRDGDFRDGRRWDGDHSGDWDRRDRYGRERNRNLYGDRGQRARIANTRSNVPRFRDWRGDGQRFADNRRTGPRDDRRDDQRRGDERGDERRDRRSGGDRTRDQLVVDNKKIAQSRTGPVQRSDLRMKARVRDANRAASRQNMVADDSGRVHREPERRAMRSADRRDEAARPDTPAKRGENRTGPVTRNDIRARAERVDRDAKLAENRTAPVARSDIRARGERVVTDAKRTENRAGPVSRSDTPARAARVAGRNVPSTRPDRERQSAAPGRDNRIVSQPSQVATRPNRQAEDRAIANRQRQSAPAAPRLTPSQGREVRREERADRHLIAPAGQAAIRGRDERVTREFTRPSQPDQSRGRDTRSDQRVTRQIGPPPWARQSDPRQFQRSWQVGESARQAPSRERDERAERHFSAPPQERRAAPAPQQREFRAPSRPQPSQARESRAGESAPARRGPERSGREDRGREGSSERGRNRDRDRRSNRN